MKNVISRLYLENFQSIKDSFEFEFSPITLFYGQNSVGKSAVFDAMKLLSDLCLGKASRQELVKNTYCRDSDNTMIIGAGFSVGYPSGHWDDQFIINLDEVIPSFNYFIDGYDFETKSIDKDPLADESDPSLEIDIFFRIKNGWIERIEIILEREKFINYNNDDSSLEIYLSNIYMKKLNKRIKEDTGLLFENLCREVMPHENKENYNGMVIEGDVLCINDVYESFNEPITGQMFDSMENPFFSNVNADEDRKKVELILSFMFKMPITAYANIFKNTSHVGPLRKIPRTEDLFFHVERYGKNKEYSRLHSVSDWDMNWFDGSIAWKYLAEDSNKYSSNEEELELVDSVNMWMSSDNKLGMQYKIDRFVSVITYDKEAIENKLDDNISFNKMYPSGIVELKLNLANSKNLNIPLGLDDVGSGVSQVVPILVSGYKNKQILIEQPELHLHPKLQTDLSDYFIYRWNVGDLYSVIETHSEYLALRFLRRIRESISSDIMPDDIRLNKEDIAFYYFDSNGVSTQVKKLRVSDDGDFLDRWPKGFFSERERELFDDDY